MRLRSSQRAGGGAERSGRIGETLALDPAVIADVVQHQARTGNLFGESAVALGASTPEEVSRAVEAQQGFSVLQENDPRIDPVVVSAFDPTDPLAMTMRSLRGLVTTANRIDGGAVRSLAIIGLDTGAESPVLTANLAVAFAQAGYRTLLVDADIANPQHHVLFRLRNREGLTTILSGAGRAITVAQPTAVNGLSVVTSGPRVPNASELLDRRRLADGLEAVLDDFDLVLVDAGDGVENAISAALGLDATVIAVRRDITESRLLSRVVDRLQAGEMTVLGTILVD